MSTYLTSAFSDLPKSYASTQVFEFFFGFGKYNFSLENSPLIAALVSILVYDKHLLSNNVYPQYFDGSSIQILHNPDGLYLLKVYVNGTYRKIYLDNYFPVMGSNETYGHLSETDLLLPLWTKAFWKVVSNCVRLLYR